MGQLTARNDRHRGIRHAWELVCLLSACAFAHAQINGPNILLQGRFSPGQSQSNARLPQTFSWPASSVFASFEGATSISINIVALPQKGSISYSINWFRFFVDDQFAADGFTSYNQLALAVTLNLTSSAHTLRIAKMNDGAKGEATLQGLSLNSGRFVEPKAPPTLASGRRILFLGDSYSVGYGNAGAVLPNTCKPTPQQLQKDWTDTCSALKITVPTECASLWQVFNQNGLQAFSAVAAETLGADYQIIGTSGGGMVGYSNAAESHPELTPLEYEAILPSNKALFNRSIYADSSSQYNLKSWVPQIVVVASGTNDWHSIPPLYTLEEWINEAIAFLQQVSDTYNKPLIIIQSWPGDQQLAETLNGEDGFNETLQYMQAMPSLFTEAVKKGLPNVQFLQLTTGNYDNLYNWCDGHPSAVADRAIAQQLVSFIGAVQPSWKATSPINTTVDQVGIRPNTSLYASGSTTTSTSANSAG